MKNLNDDAMKKLDNLLINLDSVLRYLNRNIANGSIKGQIDIQRINQLNEAYNDFISASRD